MPGISQKNSIVFVFFYCSPTAKRRPKTPPKRTIPHQMIHFWFSGFPGKSKCRVKNDVFVGIRTSKSKNRSPVWPVIWKVFCRIKWSIISGASIWGGPLESRETAKSRPNSDFRHFLGNEPLSGFSGNSREMAGWERIPGKWLAGSDLGSSPEVWLGAIWGAPQRSGWDSWGLAGVWLGTLRSG